MKLNLKPLNAAIGSRDTRAAINELETLLAADLDGTWCAIREKELLLKPPSKMLRAALRATWVRALLAQRDGRVLRDTLRSKNGNGWHEMARRARYIHGAMNHPIRRD